MKPQRSLRLPIIIGLLIITALGISFDAWKVIRIMISTPTPIPAIVLNLAPDATPSLGLSVLDSTGTAMVYVPAGCFIMGKDALPDDFGNTERPFKMCLPHGYWIDKNDVTNADYQQFIDAGGYDQQGNWWSDPGWAWVDRSTLFSLNGSRPYNYDGFTAPQQPRVGVEWYEASAYCHWRGARLPTEPEWE